MRGALRLIVLASGCVSGCASLSPMPPRFIVVYDQRSQACRIQVVRDTRSSGCWVAFTCGRGAPVVVTATADVCAP